MSSNGVSNDVVNMPNNSFRNFRVASYLVAQYIERATEEEMQRGIDFFKQHVHLDKVYLENHRGTTDISVERMKRVKELFDRNGIETSGGITATNLVDGKSKNSYYDTLCYTDPRHREVFLKSVKELAEVFDEIILDDFYFTACRCEMCIEAKGERSWKEYRLKLMEDFSREMVDAAKAVNPKLNFIIKYPNWYESYQETGYNPGKQKDIFDMIYTGTETRNAFYDHQHLQRYESYSIMRLLEHIAPDRNGGGWIDSYGSTDNINRFLEQAELTILGKAKELMLFNFSDMVDSSVLPPLGITLKRFDKIAGMLGKPVGVAAWEPYDADGEDQLYNYLGQCGVAIEPSPDFDDQAGTVLLTQSSAYEPDAVEKLERFVRQGGNAVVTVGFLHETYDRGIKEMTSVRTTHRHVLAGEFLVEHYGYWGSDAAKSSEKVLFEVLDFKNNATHAEIMILAGEDNFPLMTEDSYGRGWLYILNVPENFADLYKLPKAVLSAVNMRLGMGQKVYVAAEPQVNFFAYDNNRYGIQSHRPVTDKVQVVVRGECKGIRDLETGRVYEDKLPLPMPFVAGEDAASRKERQEYAFEVRLWPGGSMFFEVMD